jgi:hypothetical protein
MLASTPTTADTPRGHITNMAALECLRDIGLEETCKRVAVKVTPRSTRAGVEAWLEKSSHGYTPGEMIPSVL